MPSCYVYHKCLAFQTTLNYILRFVFYLYKCKDAQFMFMDSIKKAKTPYRKNPQGLREVAFYSQASLAVVCQDKEHPELRGGQASNCSRQAYPKPCPSLGGQDPVQHPPGVLLRTRRATAAMRAGGTEKGESSFLHKPGKTESGVENKNGLSSSLHIYSCKFTNVAGFCACACMRACFSLNRNLKGQALLTDKRFSLCFSFFQFFHSYFQEKLSRQLALTDSTGVFHKSRPTI